LSVEFVSVAKKRMANEDFLAQEFDDPNTTITNILDNCRQIGIAIDFAPSKLKQVSLYSFACST